VAEDPGDFRARRSRRRRRNGDEARPDAVDETSIDAAQPVDAAPPPAPIEDRPLPTFLRGGSGFDRSADALSDADRGSEVVAAESPDAADRILDSGAENVAARAVPAAVEPPAEVALPTPSPVDHSWLPILETDKHRIQRADAETKLSLRALLDEFSELVAVPVPFFE